MSENDQKEDVASENTTTITCFREDWSDEECECKVCSCPKGHTDRNECIFEEPCPECGIECATCGELAKFFVSENFFYFHELDRTEITGFCSDNCYVESHRGTFAD